MKFNIIFFIIVVIFGCFLKISQAFPQIQTSDFVFPEDVEYNTNIVFPENLESGSNFMSPEEAERHEIEAQIFGFSRFPANNNGEAAASSGGAAERQCVPLGGLCYRADDCCNNRCNSYAYKCVT